MRSEKEPTQRDPSSDLHFRPVTTETLQDFTDFRDTNPVCAACSCMKWRTHAALFPHMTGKDRAVAFDALVGSGAPVGVMAYRDGSPVGWCSVAPRNTLVALKSRSYPPGADVTRIWAVTCLYVDPRHRREGISVRLLRAAVEYARSEGARMIEGYPVESRRDPTSSSGSPSTFRRAGFLDSTPLGRRRHVMRNVVR